MRALRRLRQAIGEERYRLSTHAHEEMDEDGFAAGDVESIILKGEVERVLAHDPRGVRFEVAGPATDGRRGHVVCRFLPSRVLLIITAYAESEEEGYADEET